MDSEIKKCIDCGGEWEYTADERAHIERNGYEAPKRCHECRAKKRARFQEK